MHLGKKVKGSVSFCGKASGTDGIIQTLRTIEGLLIQRDLRKGGQRLVQFVLGFVLNSQEKCPESHSHLASLSSRTLTQSLQDV